MLGGGDLVVLRLGQHAQLPELLVQLAHERGHAGLDRTVVVVIQLLALGRLCAEQRPAAQLQIGAAVVHGGVDEEIFLLRADLRDNVLCLGVAEQPQDADACLVQLPHGAQQRRFLIQRLTAVGAEYGGDIQCFVLYKGVGRGVPCGVAPGLKGGAQTAGGEGGGVRLALAQLLGTQLHDHAVLAVAGDKAVMLFSGEAGHGLEPVGEVGSALFDGPVLHGAGDLTGYGTIQCRSLGQSLLPCLVRLGGQTLLHLLLTKHHSAKQGGNIGFLFTHKDHSFQNKLQ